MLGFLVYEKAGLTRHLLTIGKEESLRTARLIPSVYVSGDRDGKKDLQRITLVLQFGKFLLSESIVP